MYFTPSCICSSSCSGSLRVLPYCWSLSSLITEFHHLYLLLREGFSKTIVNAYRELTDNLHVSEQKQFRVKTAAKFRQQNKYKSYVCQVISELVLEGHSIVLNFMTFCTQSGVLGKYQQKGQYLAKLKAVGKLPPTSMRPRFHRKYLNCLHTHNDATQIPAYSLPHRHICRQLFVCLQTDSEQHHLHVFIKWVSNGPLSLPHAIGISIKRHTRNVQLLTHFSTLWKQLYMVYSK